jgi:C-terminal processing protease CtpA/Prc
MDATRQRIASEFADYTVRSQVVGVGLHLAESVPLLWGPKCVEVHEVVYGFAAMEDGHIQVGDRVLAIDGHEVHGMELAAIKEVYICKGSNARTIHFT